MVKIYSVVGHRYLVIMWTGRNPLIVGTKKRTSILLAENRLRWNLVRDSSTTFFISHTNFVIWKTPFICIIVYIRFRPFHSSRLASQSRIRSWPCPKSQRSDIRSCQLRSSWKLFRAVQRERSTRWVRKKNYFVTRNYVNYVLSDGK